MYFSNLFALRLTDPYEGTLPEKILKLYQDLASSGEEWKFAASGTVRSYEELSRNTSVNCWHMNTKESIAMWKLYLLSGEGVAIRSSFDQLKTCFVCPTDTLTTPIYISKVTYMNHPEAEKPAGIRFNPIIFKHYAFEYECELRAFILQTYQVHNTNEPEKAEIPSGISIPIDLEKLISAVVLPPNCPEWMKELVASLLEKYEVNVVVEKSKLKIPILRS